MQHFFARRMVLALLTAIIVITGPLTVVSRTHAQEAVDQGAPFTWWMEPRYAQGWQRYDPVQHSYPSDYLYPAGWEVGFDACNTPLGDDGSPVSYSWMITGTTIEYSTSLGPLSDCRLDQSTSPAPPALPAQGIYSVSLTIAFDDGKTVSASQTIEIRDLLIVSIGDSYASGEGNPHINEVGGIRPANDIWFEPRCHRSAHSGHARTAAAIETGDPHSSVTFLSFACSGAEIWDGLVSGYMGAESPDNEIFYELDPQLISLMEHLCQRTIENPGCISNPRAIDSLFLSVGGNDAGFGMVMERCAMEKKIEDINVEDVWIPGVVDILTGWDWSAIKDNPVDYILGPLDEIFMDLLDRVFNVFGSDYFACGEDLDPILNMNFAALWSHYDLLAELLAGNADEVAANIRSNSNAYYWTSPSLRAKFQQYYGNLTPAMARSVVPDNVYLTSYPADPFQDEHGNHTGCGIFFGLEPEEAAWIGEKGERLNSILEWIATQRRWVSADHRWHFVGGISADFDQHGYCAGDESYFVSFTSSYWNQSNKKGTMHPNATGHNVIRDQLLASYVSDKQDWSATQGVTVEVESVRISDNRIEPQATAQFTAKVNDSWYRYPNMLAQIDVPVGEWFELPEESFQYYAKLADDEELLVIAHTSLGAGIFYPPKCYTPECAQVIPPTKLRIAREHALANGWGVDSSWCEAGTGQSGKPHSHEIGLYSKVRHCTATTSSADFELEIRYRITIVDLALAAYFGEHVPDDPVVCGDHCNGYGNVVRQSNESSFAKFIAFLEANGEDVAIVRALVNYIDQQYVVAAE